MVTTDSEPQGADVHMNSRNVGETPVTIQMSNLAEDDPHVVIRRDGYRDNYVRVDKEIKVLNGGVGLFLRWPSLLWAYGPKPYQYADPIEE